ncbi:sugar ABC transporter permease [Dactylosporangium sp. NPDC049525]|uniref:carbohydrate ABC transporter permease n=1 Tax=Dactylosporangium sp. NPDC049525 TaxID=3154730 RepID=UPI00341C09D9
MTTTTVAARQQRSRATRPAHHRDGPLGRQRRRLYWPFLAPALTLYLAFVIGPAISGVWISLHSWRGAGDEMKWVGLANYRRLWSDDIFRTSFLNSLEILTICGVAVFAIAFIMTVVLREMRGRYAIRSLLFFPYIVSPIAIGVGLGLLLDPQGLANASLRAVGLDMLARPWLAPEHLFSTILIGIVWVSTGFYVVILMAGVDRIPKYFYEDAELAGANQWQRFRHVTLPLSWDVVSVAAVLWVINSMKIFEFIYAFVGTGDSPNPDTRTVPIQQFIVTTGGRSPAYLLGYGCAMGVVLVAAIAMFVVLLRRVMRRDTIQF